MLLGSTVGKYIIIAMVLAALGLTGYLCVNYVINTIGTLNQQVAALSAQAASLKAANDAMKTDIDNIKAAQDQANKNLNDIRVQSAQTAAKVRNQTFNTSNPQALQNQVNQDTANAFQTLEDLSK